MTLKPFGILCMVLIVGFNLSGLPVIGFYMIPLLLEAEIHIDPYLAAAMLATWRGIMSLIGTPMIGRFLKRTVHFCCGIVLTIGLLSLSAFTFFNQDSGLVHNAPTLGWIPIISILLIYNSVSLGWLSIIFQLRVSNNISISKNFKVIYIIVGCIVTCKSKIPWEWSPRLLRVPDFVCCYQVSANLVRDAWCSWNISHECMFYHWFDGIQLLFYARNNRIDARRNRRDVPTKTAKMIDNFADLQSEIKTFLL